ncbi:unnamed protein product [Penicillium salamii]|nr:unnamed protein product [Penicillium salamii]CAG8276121.1 unnamed protein product [Penicillium salamii]
MLLPDSDGNYSVAMRVHTLTDTNRMDPYASKHAGNHRSIITSIFWPVNRTSPCELEAVSYMPPATAAAYGQYAASMGLPVEIFSAIRLNFCRVDRDRNWYSNEKDVKYPLAVFSPGSGVSRLVYSGIARALASRGYVTVTVDHPYDADIVEFPDGEVVFRTEIPADDSTREMAIQVRSEDLSFVVSQFHDAPSRSVLTKGLPGKIDLSRIVAWGHSLGGATAAQTMLQDDRIYAGANLDGRLSNNVLNKGLDNPFLLLGRADDGSRDATWTQFWEVLGGLKVELALAGAKHGSFIDYALLVEALHLNDHYQSLLEPVLGTIAGTKMQNIVADTLDGFFNDVLHGNGGLANAVKKYSEVTEVNSTLS